VPGVAHDPAVSICIPASRHADGLRSAVQSVLAQDYDDLELVITDDSGGALADTARAFADSRVRYFPNPRRLGLAGNHMAALDRARGRYLGFLHDDDRFLPNYVGTVAECLASDPSVGVVLTDRWIETGFTPHERLPPELPAGRHERFLDHVMRSGRFVPSAAMLRREVWEQSPRGWPDLVCGDLALFVDAAVAGWALLYVDEPLVVYRLHPQQTGADEATIRDHGVRFWDGYRFDDPEAESRRRQTLARWLVARAGAHLKGGRPSEAKADLRRARELDPRGRGARERALSLLATFPALVPPAHRLWRRLRPRPRVAPLAHD
jgi:glycosyltransferase involved in cell wall biosynthesis